MRTVNFIGYIIVLIAASESSVIKPRSIPYDDSSRITNSRRDEMPSKVPNISGKDKNLRAPPFGDPKLTDDGFELYDDYGGGVPDFSSEYDYKNTLDIEGKDFMKPGKIPETHPGNHGNYPGDKRDDDDRKVHEESDKGNDLDKPIEESDKDNDFDKPIDHGSDKTFDSEEDADKPIDHDYDDHSEEDEIHKDIDDTSDHGSGESFDAEEYTEKPTDLDGEPDDEHIDKDGDKDTDESHDEADEEDVDNDIDVSHDDEDEGDEDVSDIDEAVAESSYGGFVFETPFFNVRQVTKYFQQLEKALEQVFRQTMDEATLLNGTYANTTEEEVEIDGKKYLVQKSVIQGKDNHSSLYVEALSKKDARNKTKEVKDSGL